MRRRAGQGPGSGLGVDVRGALNLTGSLFKPLGLAFAVPAVVAAGYGEAVWPFVLAGALTFSFGAALEAATSGKERVGAREGYFVVALLWLLVAVFGAVPYVFAEPQLAHPVDAFFESMSGFSSAGASVMTDVEAMERSTAIWRALTAWIGGLGIIVLFLSVLPRLNVGGRQALFRMESAGPEIGLEATIRDTARRFATLYVAITAVEILVLAMYGWTGIDDEMTPFRAIAHSLTTVATAGFTTEARSMETFGATTQWTVVVFMVAAGTNFALLFAGLVQRRPRALAGDEEFRVYLGVIAAIALIVLLGLVSESVFAGEAAVRHATFNTVSMLTTTGFASADFAHWPPLTTVALFAAVLVSASAGSTSGSIKLVRHLVIAKMLRRELHHTVYPELVAPLRLNGTVIEERTLRAIIVFVFLYLGICAAGAGVLLVDATLQDLDVTAFDSLADSAAALGGSGSGLGFAGPMGSFDPFSYVSKLILTVEMYLGRLEIVPVLVLFARSFWRA